MRALLQFPASRIWTCGSEIVMLDAMKYSSLFAKTHKEAPREAESANAKLLVQAGYIDQLMAGVYSYLPLGLRILNNIQNIIREEMNAIGGQEILLPALHPKEPWMATKRWESPGPEIMFQFKGAGDRDVGLGWTHEEIVTPLVQKYVKSYKDLPVAVYQIQDKFRNELRAKSGILRGREFNMKDLYSFHADTNDMDRYYEEVLEAYKRVFARCGIDAILTEASGGDFSPLSHEFQMPTEAGEDTIYVNANRDYAWNQEIVPDMKDGGEAPDGTGPVKAMRAIEVGNIFKLGTKFTEPIDFTYMDETGAKKPVYMCSYGIGPSRLLGAIVESHHDDRGMKWPKAVAPFAVHLIDLPSRNEEMKGNLKQAAQDLYDLLEDAGVSVLWDDTDSGPGEKLGNADLMGIPLRILLSEKTMRENSVEWKERSEEDIELVSIGEVVEKIQIFVENK
jgi:prolyl-tRNA synthetase